MVIRITGSGRNLDQQEPNSMQLPFRLFEDFFNNGVIAITIPQKPEIRPRTITISKP